MNNGSRRIVFLVGEQRFSIDMLHVSEVREQQPLSVIPRAPRWFLGVMNFHGIPVALLDLQTYLTSDPPADAAKRVVVLDGNIANLALRVDAVAGFIGNDEILEIRDGEDALTAHTLVMADGEIRDLALPALLDELEATINGLGGSSGR